MIVERRWRIGLRVVALSWFGLLLLAPVGLVFYRTFEHGVGAVIDSITTPAAVSAFWLTIEVTAIAVPLNAIVGVLMALRRRDGLVTAGALAPHPRTAPSMPRCWHGWSGRWGEIGRASCRERE